MVSLTLFCFTLAVLRETPQEHVPFAILAITVERSHQKAERLEKIRYVKMSWLMGICPLSFYRPRAYKCWCLYIRTIHYSLPLDQEVK